MPSSVNMKNIRRQFSILALRGDYSLNCECCTVQISFQGKQQVARLNVSLYVVNQVQQEIKRLNCKRLWDRNNILKLELSDLKYKM